MKLRVNGVERSVDPDWHENLLVVLREQPMVAGVGACVVLTAPVAHG